MQVLLPMCPVRTLREWLQDRDMKHTRGAPYHPMTQGKIERYHRSMKNVIKLEHYYFPWELENAIAEWVAHYNHCSSIPPDTRLSSDFSSISQ